MSEPVSVSGHTYLAGHGRVEHETILRDGKIDCIILKMPGKSLEFKLSDTGAVSEIVVAGGLGSKSFTVNFGGNHGG